MTQNLFTPSAAWAQAFYGAGCPLARVRLSFSDAPVQAIEAASRAYFATLQEDKNPTNYGADYDQVFYAGGWVYGVIWCQDGYPAVVLESAGEDGLSSLEWAAQDYTQALEKECLELRVSYEELPF